MKTNTVQFDFRRAIGAEFGSYLKFLPTLLESGRATLMVCVRGDGSDSSITMRFEPDTLEQMANDCNEAARIIRRMEDEKLNAEIADLDVKYPKVA